MSKVYFDIEASGLNPFRHEIIEVGYVVEDERGKVTTEVEFTLPFSTSGASQEALEVNGYWSRLEKGELPPKMKRSEAATMMLRDFDGATMVVNSLQFDLGFTSAFLNRFGELHAMLNPTPWSHRSIDLKSVTAGKLGIDLEALKTDAIMRHFGLKNDAAHTALADAWFNRDWYKALDLYVP